MQKTLTVGCQGGEARIETSPERKHVVEEFTPLEQSILWKFVTNYYKKMAITAWSANYVPMFITSNSRLAKSYSKIFLNFLKDIYSLSSPTSPIYIIETGGGHGRFTYLFLRHTLRFKTLWTILGKEKPAFVYIFTDIIQENIDFCKKQKCFQEFIKEGYLDFSLFNANQDCSSNASQLYLQIAKTPLPKGHPIVLIANYVLDSLLTGAIQIIPYKANNQMMLQFKRSLVKVFSSIPEPNLEDPDIVSRMSLQWKWVPIDVPSSLKIPNVQREATLTDELVKSTELIDPILPQSNIKHDNTFFHKTLEASPSYSQQNSDDQSSLHRSQHLENESFQQCPEYLLSNEKIYSVIEAYAAESMRGGYPLSFLVPFGAFRLIALLHEFSRGQLLCLIGDKGYQDTSEFRGVLKHPHIAIHGAISFMVNLHSIRIFLQTFEGFCLHTPFKDTFQVIVGYSIPNGLNEINMEISRVNLLREMSDIVPDTLVSLQRYLQNNLTSNKNALHPYARGGNIDIKTLLSLLRLSAHDPDVFINFFNDWNALTTATSLGIRCEEDIQYDFELVFEHWYKLGEGEDLPDLLAQLCMKMGRLHRALYFFEKSLCLCPEGRHPATYVNIASCYKALGEIEKAETSLQLGLDMNANFFPALHLQKELQMYKRKLHVAFVGCGSWSLNNVLKIFQKDPRISCDAFFTFDILSDKIKNSIQTLLSHKNPCQNVVFYSKQEGFQELLLNHKIDACIVDVSPRVAVPLVTQLWEAGKHTFMLTPLSSSLQEATMIFEHYFDHHIDKVSERILHLKHVKMNVVGCIACCYEYEEVFEAAIVWSLSHDLGDVIGISCICHDESPGRQFSDTSSTASYMNALAVKLLNGLLGIQRLLPDYHLETISCILKETNETMENDEAHHKETDRRPAIVAWFRLRHKGHPEENKMVVGHSFCSIISGYRLVRFVVQYTNGLITLEKTDTSWTLKLSSSQYTKEVKFPSDGFTNAHNTFLEEIQNTRKVDLPCEASVEDLLSAQHSNNDASSTCSTISEKNEPPAKIVTIPTDLGKISDDILILESILASIQKGCAVNLFRDKNIPNDAGCTQS